MPLTNPTLEGYNVVRNMWMKYYNPLKGTFIAPQKCNGCYNDDRFVIWAVAVAVQAVVDSARIYPEMIPLIEPSIRIFQKYKNTQMKGFSAAENGGADKDIYYDDDAQVASCMLTAFEVTGDKRYLDQGRELVRFLMGGWNDDPHAVTKGGVLWHVSKTYLNACTTAEVAKCCLQISKFIPNEAQHYIDFAAKCIDWQIKVLQDPKDKLIMDGVHKELDKVDDAKWSYNAGTTLSCASHLYFITRDDKWKQIATQLAQTVIDRNVTIYDRDYPMDKRYWRDSSYFVQLLIEGLADYLLYMGQEAPSELPDKIHEEIQRHLIMFYEYSRDPRDQLYIQSFEPHKTYNENKQKYIDHFEGKKDVGLKSEDCDSNGNSQKCLMGCGAAARCFFQGARVVPRIG
ncbi:uncharacterized protein KQ657_001116 [Scheffersomyces spartinae]|uniref:Mannan endo-1,6-alpha-mannosidase n=1 Tax=Scheffersomyces spartinae TaxID=45513 RepID=A0A9P8AHY3_9ASCO|nr:uncharacterized protein KQ657_001116 [Scheffersomyces spartinae]KAG7193003.1 hypothetical protein KQ657_001116 [Scheffersomyces spartinae]